MTGPGHEPILRLEGLTLRYGALTAVDHVDLTVRDGARHALIGPNGAGKSSLFSVVAGAVQATEGKVILGGKDVSGLNEAGRARVGLVRTFQHSSLFLGISVLDNVRLAVERAHGRPKRPWPMPRADRVITEQAMGHLEAVGLVDRRSSLCGALSHGERRQLEVAMVLACDPRLVLFDEPTAGMSAAETQRFSELVEALPSQITTVVVEHDLDVVFRLADRVSVLAAGRLIADGTPDEVRADEAVKEAYLGKPRSAEPLFGGMS
jgi:branched-chain amino acid transport system ATP-binding protein